jgi:adenine deaminase
MTTIADRKSLVDVALAATPPDLVLADARLVNVLTREITRSDIAIKNGRVAAVAPAGTGGWLKCPRQDLAGRYVAPGFIDAHVHVESSMVTVAEYAKAAVAHGVTMIAADPHEIGNVLGIAGMKLMFDEAKTVPLRMRLRVPGRIPAMPDWLETSGARIDVEETRALMDWPEAVCLAGDINPRLILNRDEEQFAKVDMAITRGFTVSGQSPGLLGDELNAFAAAGPEDSHVALSAAEIVENQRVGMRSVLTFRPHRLDRSQFRELARIIAERGLETRFLQFCTDDVYPHDVVEEGLIDMRVRLAIEEGFDPITAYQVGTLNVAEGLRIDREYGAIAPGRFADLMVLENFEKVAIDSVMINGEWVFRDGEYLGGKRSFHYPQWSKETMRVERPLTASDMRIEVSHNAHSARVRAIAATTPKSEREFVLPVEAGVVLPDAEQDVSSIVVVERHKASGRLGKGFVTSLFVKRGAIASTVSHDAHNLMVIGADHEDMAIAANSVIEAGGGYAVVVDGEVVFRLQLPVAGLMSEEPIEMVAEQTRRLVDIMINRLGCPPVEKLLARMNMLSLPNIPNFGFTDHGMIFTQSMAAVNSVIEQGDEIEKHF